jgi:hypothetical protein
VREIRCAGLHLSGLRIVRWKTVSLFGQRPVCSILLTPEENAADVSILSKGAASRFVHRRDAEGAEKCNFSEGWSRESQVSNVARFFDLAQGGPWGTRPTPGLFTAETPRAPRISNFLRKGVVESQVSNVARFFDLAQGGPWGTRPTPGLFTAETPRALRTGADFPSLRRSPAPYHG